VKPMSFKVFIQMVLVSTFHKTHEAEKETDGPRFRFLQILLCDRN
jgi:hypothetical protein